VSNFTSSKSEKTKKRRRAKEINVSMCAINLQEDFLNDLENPLMTDEDSSEWFEDESQFSSQEVNHVHLFLFILLFRKQSIQKGSEKFTEVSQLWMM